MQVNTKPHSSKIFTFKATITGYMRTVAQVERITVDAVAAILTRQKKDT